MFSGRNVPVLYEPIEIGEEETKAYYNADLNRCDKQPRFPASKPGSPVFYFYFEAMLRFQGHAVHGDLSRLM